MSRDGKRMPLKTEAGSRDVICIDELARISNGVGRTLDYTRLRRAFNTAAKEAGVANATPHTCRYTFASSPIHQGSTAEFVADQLGHESTKTTWDFYVHLFRAREQAAAAEPVLTPPSAGSSVPPPRSRSMMSVPYRTRVKARNKRLPKPAATRGHCRTA